MKKLNAAVIVLLYLSAWGQAADILHKVDWKEFMAQHDLIWDELPLRWENGPFSGNGLFGSTIYVNPNASEIKVLVSRSDIGKLGMPQNWKRTMRGNTGSMDLHTVGNIQVEKSSARLNLWNSEITASIKTTKGGFKLRSYIAADEPVIVVELFDFEGEEKSARWIDRFGGTTRAVKEGDITFCETPDKMYSKRAKVASGGYVAAWMETVSKDRRALCLALTSSPATDSIWNKGPRGKLSAKEDAWKALGNVKNKGIDKVFEEQAEWWHNFYKKSFVSFKRKEIESYYWIQLYKMASSARKGYPMIDNHGVWQQEPTYGYTTWDLNVQAIYRLHLASNHEDLGEPLISFLDDNYNRETMWNEKAGELRAGVPLMTFMRYDFFDTNNWEQSDPASGPALFLWGCHNYWLQYQYTMDKTLLPKLRDKLEGGINALLTKMKKESDGYWHIPVGFNWECWKGRDPNCILAVMKWSLETIAKIETDKKKLAKWTSLRKEIAPYVVGDKGYLLGVGKDPVAHRHWSHLLHLFPLRTTTWAEKNKRELIKKSVDVWTDLAAGVTGRKEPRAGYSPCAAICLYAQMKNTDRIPELINTFLYRRSSRGPNVWASTMYREYGPVIETPLFFAATMHELFLQSHEGSISLFPAMPEGFDDMVFDNYLTEGGFLVNARRVNGKTAFVKLTSQHGGPVTLDMDMQNIQVDKQSSEKYIKKQADGSYLITLPAGESILLYDKTLKDHLVISQVKNQTGDANTYGLNERFYKGREFIKKFQIKGR